MTDPGALLTLENRHAVTELLGRVIRSGLDFKLTASPRPAPVRPLAGAPIPPAPRHGQPMSDVLDEFENEILPQCVNPASPRYAAFPYAGTAVAGLVGAVYADLLQQNLLSAHSAPAATRLEFEVIGWLRELLRYPCPEAPRSVLDAGGLATFGGNLSNTYALIAMARRHERRTGRQGLLVLPEHISHYGVPFSAEILRCFSDVRFVPVKAFKYDLTALASFLNRDGAEVAGVVAFAGDAKAMSVDALGAIHDLRQAHCPHAWLHADASHGFCLAFSERLKSRLEGIQTFDSVTLDPHKVLNVPYPLSYVLFRDGAQMTHLADHELNRDAASSSEVTPFVSSRPWLSLKLWFLLKAAGTSGLGELVDARYDEAQAFAAVIAGEDDFALLAHPEAMSVLFAYVGPDPAAATLETVNRHSQWAYHTLLAAGIELDRPRLKAFTFNGETGDLHPLKYMTGNPVQGDALARDIVAVLRAAGRTR